MFIVTSNVRESRTYSIINCTVHNSNLQHYSINVCVFSLLPASSLLGCCHVGSSSAGGWNFQLVIGFASSKSLSDSSGGVVELPLHFYSNFNFSSLLRLECWFQPSALNCGCWTSISSQLLTDNYRTKRQPGRQTVNQYYLVGTRDGAVTSSFRHCSSPDSSKVIGHCRRQLRWCNRFLHFNSRVWTIVLSQPQMVLQTGLCWSSDVVQSPNSLDTYCTSLFLSRNQFLSLIHISEPTRPY